MPSRLLAGAKTSRLSGIALSGSLGTTFLSARRVCLRDFSNHPVSSNRWFLTNVDHFILLRSSSSARPSLRVLLLVVKASFFSLVHVHNVLVVFASAFELVVRGE